MFSEIADRNWNYKGVKLPSGCVVPGSWSFHTFGCCFVNWRGGLMRWTISGFLVLLGWAPCQVSTRLGKLASLNSKSTCNLCVTFGVQGAVLASAFLCPVCSISWLGIGSYPHRWGRENWSKVCLSSTCYFCWSHTWGVPLYHIVITMHMNLLRVRCLWGLPSSNYHACLLPHVNHTWGLPPTI